MEGESLLWKCVRNVTYKSLACVPVWRVECANVFGIETEENGERQESNVDEILGKHGLRTRPESETLPNVSETQR